MCKLAVEAVLERCCDRDDFIGELTEDCSKALKEYNLSDEERSALIEGDIEWTREHLDGLTEGQEKWFKCRLQQERW